jgi:two-component sensor histidine kinase
MALNPKLSTARRNAMLDNCLANANSGILRIYDGTQPADADTAVSTQNILAELTMNATAFAAASGGSASANAISNDSSANNTGTATWFRLFKSDGTTAIMDGSAGTGTVNLVLNSAAISSGAIVSVTSFTVTFPT